MPTPDNKPLLYGPDGRLVQSQTETPDEYATGSDEYDEQPKTNLYHELPVYGVPPPDRLWVVEGILQQLEVGNFHDASLMWDAMMRDARVKGVVGSRIQALLGAGVECDTYLDEESGAEDAKAALVSGELHSSWPNMHNAAQLAKGMRYALGLGVAVVQKIYTNGDRWDYRLKVWHNQFLQWRHDTRAYHLTTQNMGQIQLPREGERSADWIILTPFGYENAFLEGLIRATVAPWIGRNWDQNDWARFNEIHGRPIRKAKVPQAAKDRDKRNFLSQLQNINAETTIRTPADKDGNLYDLTLLEATSQSWQSFERKLIWADKTLAVLWLSQSSSTDGSSGLGSDEAPGERVNLRVMKFDNTWLSQGLYDQGVREWVAFNWGNPDLAPRPPQDDKRSGYWQVEPAEDSAKRATEFKDFSSGCQAMAANEKTANVIDWRDLLDSFGTPIVTEEEQAQLEQEAEDRKREQAQQQADALARTQNGQPGQQQPDDKNKPGTPPAAVKPRPTRLRALSAGHLRRGARAGKNYADGLATNAKRRAADIMLSNVEDLKREIAAATGPEDLRRRLVALYRSMDPSSLAKLVAKANILAKLAGRAAVIVDL